MEKWGVRFILVMSGILLGIGSAFSPPPDCFVPGPRCRSTSRQEWVSGGLPRRMALNRDCFEVHAAGSAPKVAQIFMGFSLDRVIAQIQSSTLTRAVNAANLYIGNQTGGQREGMEGGRGNMRQGQAADQILVDQQQKLIKILSAKRKSGEAEDGNSIRAYLEKWEKNSGTGSLLALGLLDMLSSLPRAFQPGMYGDVLSHLYEHLGQNGVLHRYGAEQSLDSAAPMLSPMQIEESAVISQAEVDSDDLPLFLQLYNLLTLLMIFTTHQVQTLWLGTVAIAFAAFTSAGIEMDIERAKTALGWIAFLILDRGLLLGILVQLVGFRFVPQLKERLVVHEAGHFLMAYLMGCQVSGYYLSGLGSLFRGGIYGDGSTLFQHRELDIARKGLLNGKASGAETGLEYYDVDSLDKLASTKCKAGAGGGVESEGGLVEGAFSIGNRHAMIAMGGMAAELIVFGESKGAGHDVWRVDEVLGKLIPSSSEQDRQNTTRWALLQAIRILRAERIGLDRLRVAMLSGHGVGHCLMEIERAYSPEGGVGAFGGGDKG